MSAVRQEVISLPVAFSDRRGSQITVTPSVDEAGSLRYDFLEEGDGTWHGRVSLIEDTEMARIHLEAEFPVRDLEDPESRSLVRFCARVAVGLSAIDTRGKVLKGVIYDDQNGLETPEIFPEAVHPTIVGGPAVRGTIPEGFLADVA